MNDVLKQLMREVEKKLGINQKEIDSNFTVIDVDPIYNWKAQGPGPWCMMFVYAPQGNFLLKGWSVDVTSYRERNFQTCLTNIVYYLRTYKKRFNYWRLYIPSKSIQILEPKRSHRCFLFIETGRKAIEPYLKLRKIPKKWIPEFVPK